MDFRKKIDETFKPLVKELALVYRNEYDIQLKILIGLELCKENNPIELRTY